MEYQNKVFLENLRKYEETPFIIKILMSVFILVFVIAMTVVLSFPYCIAPQFILGALYAHMIELQHEALHGATNKKWLNRLVGFFLGAPMLISYSDYQYHHMIHHEYIGTNKDTEYFNYSDQKTFSLIRFISSLFMFSHYKNVFIKITKALFFDDFKISSKNIRKKIKREYQLLSIIIVSIIGLSIFNQNLLVLKLWFIPLFLFSAPIHFLIELPEHVFCEKNNPDIYKNTRTIQSNWLMNWFVNGNNYHVEHHYAPNYPISCLHNLHPEIKDKIVYLNKSYIEFYKLFFKKILKKQ